MRNCYEQSSPEEGPDPSAETGVSAGVYLCEGWSAAGGRRHAVDADVRAGGIGKTSRRRLRVLTQPSLAGTAPNGRRQSILQQRLTRDRMSSEAPGTSCAHLKSERL